MSNFPCGHDHDAANTDNWSGRCRECRIARQKRYRGTEKGRASNARFDASLRGRIRHNLYEATKRMKGPINA